MRRTLVLLLATAGIALSALPAAAHATLTGSDPEDGASVGEPPTEITLEFSEPIQRDFTQVAVLDGADQHHEDGQPDVVGSTVTQAVGELGPGEYRVSYRIGSADGHPVTGVITFTVAGQAAEAPDETEPPTPVNTSPARTATPSPTSPLAVPRGDQESDAPLWLGAAAAVALGAAGLVLLLRRPGGGPGNGEADTDPL